LIAHQQLACEALGFRWLSEPQRRALVRALRQDLTRTRDRQRLLVFARRWLYDHQLIIMSAITFHYYTIPTNIWKHKGAAIGFGEDEWISTLSHTSTMDRLISRNVKVLNLRDPANKIGFAVDEWGTWYDSQPGREPGFLYQQNTLRDALVAAVNFNIFHHHADRVHMANIAQMVNVLQSMILTDGPKMLLTPTYHVFSLFKPFQDATYLPTDLQAPDYRFNGVKLSALSVSAARSKSGAVIIALVNLDPHHAQSVDARLVGVTPKSVSGSVLTSAAMDAHNTFETPHAIESAVFSGAHLSAGKLSVELPAMSVVVLTLH
jgi:alpha-N-arabinofuranosidase